MGNLRWVGHMPDAGFIYILTSSADADSIKVGRTNDLQRRLREHNSASNVVGIWKLHWHLEVPDTKLAESLALKSLSRWKVKGRREQFQCKPEIATMEVSVALSNWSTWGRKEKVKREKRKALEAERKREARKSEKQQRDNQRRIEEKERTIEMLRQTFPQRKAEYEHAKRVLTGEERILYPIKFNDLFLIGLLGLSIYLYNDGEPPVWARIPTFAAYLYGLFAAIEAKERFSEWRKVKDPQSYHGTIENFEFVYPHDRPPESVDDLEHLEPDNRH